MQRTTFSFFTLATLVLGCSQTPPSQVAAEPRVEREEVAASTPDGMDESEAAGEEASGPAPNPQEIQAAIGRHSDEIRQCYVMGTFREPQLAGTVHVRFTINSTGKVSETTDGGSNMPDPQVVECVLGVFANLEFRAGKYFPTEVEYPISFGKS